MAKIKLKKSLQVVLENSKQAVVKSITDSMLKHVDTESEMAWLLLEFTLEFPFPPTIGLAQTKELEKSADSEEHPLMCYNAPDLELFSEDQTIVVDFHSYDELFSTADQLLQEIEYEDRQPFIFQLYVDVCKALMLESANWTHLKLSNDFHVTARDYEMCDEADFLKKLLPKKSFNKIKRKIDTYDAKMNDAYANDETVLKVNAVMEQEAGQYESVLSSLDMETYTDVYTQEEIYFLRPYYVETNMHKRAGEIEHELSTQKPADQSTYYQYKFSDNIPQLVDFYSNGNLTWRKIFQHKDGESTSHKFFLKSGKAEIEDYTILKKDSADLLIYEKYMNGYYDKMIFQKSNQGEIATCKHIRSMFQIGYKMDARFEYVFEYKNNDLFKIVCVDQNGQKVVSYCKDDSFMDEAIQEFVEHVWTFVDAKMKVRSLNNVDAIVLEYDHNLAFYFTIYLVVNKELLNISSYELHEDNSAMMNLTVYTSASVGSANLDYLSREKAEAYIDETYIRLCSTLSQRVYDTFQISVPVVTKYIYDNLDL